MQKQKAVLESSLQHLQHKHDAYVAEATSKAETAAAALAEAQRLNTEYANRLEVCQQEFMDLECESDAQMCARCNLFSGAVVSASGLPCPPCSNAFIP